MTEKKQNQTLVEHREAISDIVATAATVKRVPKPLADSIARAAALLTRDRGRPATITDEQFAEMQSLRAAGESYVDIGARFGLKANTVRMAIKRAADESEQ